MSKNEPKRQHFVPAFLLSNFTKNKTRNSKLEVFDFGKKGFRSSKPDKECKQNDLYTLTAPPEGTDPYIFEKEVLGKLESQIKPIVTEILRTKNLPKDTNDHELFFYFLGVLAARHPSVNEMLSMSIAQTGNILIDMIGETLNQSTLDDYYNTSKTPIKERLALHEVKNLLSTERFYAVANQNVVIPKALNAAYTIFRMLLERNWMFIVANKDEKFIICDRPMALHATSKGPKTGSLGFGLAHTEIITCLSSSVALVGTFEVIPNAIQIADIRQIALINRVMIDSARRNIFFEDRNFKWIDDDHIIRPGTEVEKATKYKKVNNQRNNHRA